MPIYEYRAIDPKRACPACCRGFEVLESISASARRTCDACGAPVQRIISAPSIGGSESSLDDRAKNAGFTKLKKISSGEYEKQY